MSEQHLTSQRPRQLILTVLILWCCSMFLGVLGTFLDWDHQMAKIPADFPMNKEIFATSIIFVTSAFLLWVYYKIYSGRNWARILFLIFYLIGLPISISTSIDMFAHSKIVALITDLQALIQLITLCLLFSKQGNAWFKAEKEMRRQQKK